MFFIFGALFLIALVLYFSMGRILHGLGEFIVHDEPAAPSDIVVVLNTGQEYYPRLIEAADLYRNGFAKRVLINGNRKNDALRSLEERGFNRCCPWYEDSLRILSMLGVPREKVIYVSIEDAYDTMTEAAAVGRVLIEKQYGKIIITTSKYHSRRAHFIWTRMFGDQWSLYTVAAKTDPYDPGGWWREGRQIRWVMAEYGAWIFYWWKNLKED